MNSVVRFENIYKRYRLWSMSTFTLREEITLFGRRINPYFWFRRSLPREKDKSYFWALNDINFEVKNGEALGIIGANGAGKTTLLKLIAGIIYPTKGKIITVGRLGSVIEMGAGIHGDLTGRENIYLYGSIIGMSRKEIRQKFESIVEFSELGRFIDEPVKYYSAGMEMRLGFSVTIHLNPDILLIDEVLAVGDEKFYHKSLEAMTKIIKSGKTVIFVSHNLASIVSFCNRALLLEKGRIISEGSPQEVILLYQSRLKDTEHLKLQGTGPMKRWGTGDIEIKKVELLQDNQWIQENRTLAGEGWGFRLEYEAQQRIGAPVFGMSIHNSKGEVVYGENNGFREERLSFVKGRGIVVFTTPSLALPAGRYSLTVYVHNLGRGIIYDWHEQAYPFEVVENKPMERVGQLYLVSSWEHQAKENQ